MTTPTPTHRPSNALALPSLGRVYRSRAVVELK